MAREETLTVDGSSMVVFTDEPANGGPHPALVVAHHRGNLDSFTTKFVQDLAATGYVAAAPNLYHRRPEGEDTMTSLKSQDDGEIIADVAATVAMLQGMPSVDNDRIGIVGHCMGGRVSFLCASVNETFKACVVYYGGNMFAPRGKSDTAPFDLLGGIKAPVIGFFGNDDENPSPDDVAKIDAALNKHGVDHTFHAYDGCGHAFQNFINPAGYRPAAAADSWGKMMAWLEKTL